MTWFLWGVLVGMPIGRYFLGTKNRIEAWRRLRMAVVHYRVMVRGSKLAADPAAYALDYLHTDSWQAQEIERLNVEIKRLQTT